MAKKKAKKKKTIKKKPSNHGRDGSGKFTKGNKCSNGSAGHKSLSDAKQLKLALFSSVTAKDIKDIAEGLIGKAKKGDVPAVKELFDRLWGKAPQAITGEGGGAIQFGNIIVKLASGKVAPSPNIEASHAGRT